MHPITGMFRNCSWKFASDRSRRGQRKLFHCSVCQGFYLTKPPLDKAETRLVKVDMEVTRKSFLFPTVDLTLLSRGHSLNSICEKELYQDAEHTRLYHNTMSFSVVFFWTIHLFVLVINFDFQLNCFPLENILIRLWLVKIVSISLSGKWIEAGIEKTSKR